MKKLVMFMIVAMVATTVNAGVVAHYAFDGDFTDSSGNGNDGTLFDGDAQGETNIATTAGDYKFGTGGYTSDGGMGPLVDFSYNRPDHVVIPTMVMASDQAWSVSVWTRKAAQDSQGMIIGDKVNTTNYLWDNATYFRMSNQIGQRADFAIGTGTSWNHVVFVADGAGSLTLYVNGSSLGTKSFNTAITFNSIGHAYGTGQFAFTGQLDELWIFDEALDQAAVTSLQTTNTVPEPATMCLLALGGLGIIRRRRNA